MVDAEFLHHTEATKTTCAFILAMRVGHTSLERKFLDASAKIKVATSGSLTVQVQRLDAACERNELPRAASTHHFPGNLLNRSPRGALLAARFVGLPGGMHALRSPRSTETE